MSSIMGYTMQHFMHKGFGSFMNSVGNDRGWMQSSFSELEGGLNNDPCHPLIQQAKNNCGLQADNQARMYTQQATGFLRENASNDPSRTKLAIWHFRRHGGRARKAATRWRRHWRYGSGLLRGGASDDNQIKMKHRGKKFEIMSDVVKVLYKGRVNLL